VAAPLSLQFDCCLKFERRNCAAFDTIPAGRSASPSTTVARKKWECELSVSERWQEIRTGFERPFWVANITELFERLSYYAVFASLANYLHESLSFSTEKTASLTGFFGGMVWFLAIIGGTVADKLGFRRALSVAYLILATSYFLLGSIAASWMAPVRNALPLGVLVFIILMLPALGVAMVKPAVVGTVAGSSKESARSIGYSIYYTMVNIGGASGPFVASFVHRHLNVENVFRVAALSVLLMVFAVLIFFREPKRTIGEKPPTIGEASRNLWTVVKNPKFMLFLLIFSGFWIVYWQQYIALPLYIHSYVNAHADVELILMTDAVAVVCLQLLISFLTRRIPGFRAIALGVLVSSLCWVIMAVHASVKTSVITLIVLALGEMILSPRYYEYVSRLAPPGQQGTYMGFAFVPIGIGSLAGGWIAGHVIHYFGEVQKKPGWIWWSFAAMGVATSLLLWIYDRVVRPGTVAPPAA
jgi:POT family proton-dependent oligopeptide transporter